MASRRESASAGVWYLAIVLLMSSFSQGRAQTPNAPPPFWSALLEVAARPDGAVSRQDVEGAFQVSMQPYSGQASLPDTSHFIARPPAPGGFTLAVWNERPGLSLFGFEWGGGPGEKPSAFPVAPAGSCILRATVGPALANRGWSLAQSLTYADLPPVEIYRKGPTGLLRVYYPGPAQCLGYVQIIHGVETHPTLPALAAAPNPDPGLHPAVVEALRTFGESHGGLQQPRAPYAIVVAAINRSPHLIDELNADFDGPLGSNQILGFDQAPSQESRSPGIAEFNPATKRIMFMPNALAGAVSEGDLVFAMGRAQDHARLAAEMAAVETTMRKRAPELMKPINGVVDGTAFAQAYMIETRKVVSAGLARGMLVGWNDYVSSLPRGAPLTAAIAGTDYAPAVTAAGGGQIGR